MARRRVVLLGLLSIATVCRCSPFVQDVAQDDALAERTYLHFAHGETRRGRSFLPASVPGDEVQVPSMPLLDQNPVPAYLRHPLPSRRKLNDRAEGSLASPGLHKRQQPASTSAPAAEATPTQRLYNPPYPPGAYIDVNNLTTQAMVAQAAVERMQTWYEGGEYEWTAWWQIPVVGMAYANFDMAFGNQVNKLLIEDLLSSKNERGVNYMIDNYIDDQAWWAMFALRAYQMYGNQTWLDSVVKIAENSSSYWSDWCGGGVLWLTFRPQYQNTITNGLYFSTLARLYRYTGTERWYNYALNTLNWWLSWGFEPSTGRVYDTITSPVCNKTGLQSWSYNSGAFLFGLADLYYATGNTTLLDLGRSIAYAGMRDFTYQDLGVLHEGCEFDPQPAPDLPPGCQQDELFFKGIFSLGLAELYLARPDPNIYNFINTNMLSVVFNNIDDTWLFGEWWQGPWNETTAGPKTQGNTLALLSAAALVNNAYLNGAGADTNVRLSGQVPVPSNTTSSANAGITAHGNVPNSALRARTASTDRTVAHWPIFLVAITALVGTALLGL